MPAAAQHPESDPRPLADVVLRPVRGHHAFETCVEQLATTIRLGVFPHGAALPSERELAERMGVSRATLREAMSALRSAGMVRTTRGRYGGSVVSYEPDAPGTHTTTAWAGRRDELLDALVFRRVVEPGAAHLAAVGELPEADREVLSTALAEVENAGSPAEHRQADSRFHLAIASLTASPLTIQAVTEVQACVHEMLGAIPVLEINITHSDSQHRTITHSILARDPARARRAMEQHCDDTAALLRGLLG